MPDLLFAITAVEPAARGLTPLLHFKMRVVNGALDEPVQAALVHAQIQIQPALRAYSPREKERLVDLFGKPERWGQTLRNRLWSHAHAQLGGFTGQTQADLPVVCTYDLNVAASKYFYSIEQGEIALLFLFSGTVFYRKNNGPLQVQQIPWSTEATFRMSGQQWHDLMAHHYPQTAWLWLRQDTFERLYAYKREHGLATWEHVMERLLPVSKEEALA